MSGDKNSLSNSINWNNVNNVVIHFIARDENIWISDLVKMCQSINTIYSDSIFLDCFKCPENEYYPLYTFKRLPTYRIMRMDTKSSVQWLFPSIVIIYSHSYLLPSHHTSTLPPSSSTSIQRACARFYCGHVTILPPAFARYVCQMAYTQMYISVRVRTTTTTHKCIFCWGLPRCDINHPLSLPSMPRMLDGANDFAMASIHAAMIVMFAMITNSSTK